MAGAFGWEKGWGAQAKACGEGPGEQLQQKLWCFPSKEMTDTIYFPKHLLQFHVQPRMIPELIFFKI